MMMGCLNILAQEAASFAPIHVGQADVEKHKMVCLFFTAVNA